MQLFRLGLQKSRRRLTRGQEKTKKFYIEESGYYKIKTKIEALSEEDAIEKLYGYLPRFIDVECDDREVEEVE